MKNEFEHIDWDLLAKYARGETSERERQMFEAWLEEDEKHKALFNSFLNLQQNKKLFASVQHLRIDVALQKVKNQRKKRTSINLKPLLKVAAMLLLAIGISFIAYRSISQSQYIVVKTSAGERIEQILNDGSEISLNENSKIRYPRKFKENRRVQLDGEAFFKVARDTSSPFIINMQNTYVKVLGTQFNVKNHKNEAKAIITVTEGRVEFGTHNKMQINPIILTVGDEGVFNKTTKQYSVTENEMNNQAAWKTKNIRFRNTTLEHVARKLEEVYLIKIHVHENLKNRKLNAVYNNQPIESIFDILESTLGVNVKTIEKNKYEIVKE